MSLSFKVVLYRHKTYKDGTHPVMLQVMENRKAKRLSLGYSCKPDQWDESKSRFKKNFPNYEIKNAELSSVQQRADLVIATAKLKQKAITATTFLQEFQGREQHDVFSFFELRRAELIEQGKAGNASVYQNTKNAVRNFHGKGFLPFEHVDYNFLTKFETHLRKRGCKDSGISYYMRTVRGLCNEAIRRGLVDQEYYPFSTQFNKGGYVVGKLKGRHLPRALSEEDLERIKNFPVAEHPELRQTWLMFIFSYYCRGMAFADMAHLRKGDIYGGRMTYVRKKSKSKITMKLHPKALEVLAEFQNEGAFVFPILSEFHQTSQQQLHRIVKKRGQYNKDLKKIAALLGIEVNLTSYVSRHSYATGLHRKGVSTAVIAQAMGHQDEQTTRHYLKQFSDDVVDETNELL